jgi:hypothetical protein
MANDTDKTPTAEAGANKLLLCGTKYRFEAVV